MNYQTPTRREFLRVIGAATLAIVGVPTLADLVFAQSYEIVPESDLQPGNKKHSGEYVLREINSNLFYSPPGQKGIAVFATREAAEEEERLLEEESALEEALANGTPNKKDYWEIRQIY